MSMRIPLAIRNDRIALNVRYGWETRTGPLHDGQRKPPPGPHSIRNPAESISSPQIGHRRRTRKQLLSPVGFKNAYAWFIAPKCTTEPGSRARSKSGITPVSPRPWNPVSQVRACAAPELQSNYATRGQEKGLQVFATTTKVQQETHSQRRAEASDPAYPR